REDKETAGFCELNSAVSQAGLRYAVREKLQIKLLRVTVSEIKLSLSFSLNDHMGSYITVLTEKGGSVTIVMREVENELNTDELTGRRNNISLQGTVIITAAVKEAEEEEDMTMRVILPQLIDTAVFTFNLAFLTVMEAATAS
ncbi:hypothetical protein BDFG_09216, partial [Blastomyces dermatitidis ATCC 26199]